MKPLIKKILRPFLAISLSVSGAAVIATAVAGAKEEATRVEAYSPSTTYNVDDTSSELTSYYSSISSTATGDTLLSQLRTLNSTKKKTTVGYGSMGTSASGAFSYTDYDPSTTSTDSKGQKYGSKVLSFYTKTSATSFNREHTWPKSHGGNLIEGDIHMTRPTISSENSDRGNSFYVEGKNSSSAGWDPYTAGYAKEMRGECARIILYGVVANSQLNVIAADSHSTSNANPDYLMGNMHTLVKWHFDYSPNEYEMNRNNGAQYLQGNRNPFIDHPEYVAKIWSSFDSTVSSLCTQNASMYDNWVPGTASSYGTNDATSGGGTTPSTNPSISVSPATASIAIDGTTNLSATLTNVTNASNVTWYSDNESVATVEKGTTTTSASAATVTGVAAGTAHIYCMYGSSVSAYATITVTSSGGGGSGGSGSFTIAVSDIPSKYSETSFTASGYSFACSNIGNSYTSGAMQWKSGQGYMYNTTAIDGITSISMATGGGTFTGTVYTGSSQNPTSGTTYSITNGNSVTITGSPSYFLIKAGTVSGGAKCGDITVNYGSGSSTPTLSSIAVKTAPTKTVYTVGEKFAPAGLVITKTMSDNTTEDVSYASSASSFTFNPSTSTALTTSHTSVTITYSGKSCSLPITVNPKTVSTLTVTGSLTNSTQYVGDEFNPAGLTVTAKYSDNTTENVTSSVEWSPSPLSDGITSVTGTFGGKTVTVNLTVVAPTLSSISTSGQNTVFGVGDTFSYGGTCTATYSNGSTKTVTPSVNSSAVNMNAAGSYTVTLSYSENGVTKTTTYTVQVKNITVNNSIKACYDAYTFPTSGKGTATKTPNDVYGLFVGSPDGESSIIVNGDYGIMLYKVAPDTSWVENETYLKITATNSTSKAYLQSFNGLLEINYSDDYISVVTDQNTIRQNIEPVSIYQVTGDETSSNKDIASRLCLLSGTVTAVETRDGTSYTDGWTDNTDNRITVKKGNKTIHLFVKSKVAATEIGTYFTDAKTSGDEITVKGFSSFYTDFQVQFKEIVEIDESYTAQNFAEDLMSMTEHVCSTSSNKEGDLSGIWLTLETEKYASLSSEQKAILLETVGNSSLEASDLEQAMARYDFIIAHYHSLNNFIGRSVTLVNVNNHFLFANSEATTAMIVIITVVGLTGIGAVLFLRRRKEN